MFYENLILSDVQTLTVFVAFRNFQCEYTSGTYFDPRILAIFPTSVSSAIMVYRIVSIYVYRQCENGKSGEGVGGKEIQRR